MNCSAPTDGRLVRTANITREGVDYGDVQLWYSPACRSVLAVAIAEPNFSCYGAVDIKAYVVHNGTVTGTGACSSGGTKAMTPWVNDANIQQAGKGAIYIHGDQFAGGVTGAY